MLSNQQIAVIDLLSDPKMTQKEAAEQAGVHPNSVTNWMKLPEFQTELRKGVVRNRRKGAPKVLEALEREALKGNAAAAKLYLQAVGYLDNREAAEVEAPKKAHVSSEELQRRLAEIQARKKAEANAQSQQATLRAIGGNHR